MDSEALATQLAFQATLRYPTEKGVVAELRLHDGTQHGCILVATGPTTNSAYRQMKQIIKEMPNSIQGWPEWFDKHPDYCRR